MPNIERREFSKLFREQAETGWVVPECCFPESMPDNFFPHARSLFKAFSLVAPNEVNYVILGQDPYFNAVEGEPIATGVAFGVRSVKGLKSGTAIYKVLKGIYGEGICGDNGKFRYTKSNLEEWAECKGILLLNASLTVPRPDDGVTDRRSVAGKHLKLKIWDKFIHQVFSQIPNAKPIAWGAEANKLLKQFYKGGKEIYQCDHPAYRSGNFAQFWESEIGKKLKCNLILPSG